jgi:hypothetical protein
LPNAEPTLAGNLAAASQPETTSPEQATQSSGPERLLESDEAVAAAEDDNDEDEEEDIPLPEGEEESAARARRKCSGGRVFLPRNRS